MMEGYEPDSLVPVFLIFVRLAFVIAAGFMVFTMPLGAFLSIMVALALLVIGGKCF